MSYPPGSPGYPSASQQSPQYAGAQQFHSPQEPVPAGPSKLPFYLSIAVVVLGLAAYLSTFFNDSGGPGYAIMAALVAALLAGVALLPKQKDSTAIVTVLAVLGFLLVLAGVISAKGEPVGWANYLILAFTLLQAIAAVWALLLDAGIVTAPVPKPKYEQPQQYNPYGGGPAPYYGQQPLQQAPHQPQQQPQQSQRPNYPPQYSGYPAGQATAAFNTGNGPAPQQQSGPPTPPTGFPAYGQPQSAGPATSVIPPQTPPQQQPAEQDSAPPPS